MKLLHLIPLLPAVAMYLGTVDAGGLEVKVENDSDDEYGDVHVSAKSDADVEVQGKVEGKGKKYGQYGSKAYESGKEEWSGNNEISGGYSSGSINKLKNGFASGGGYSEDSSKGKKSLLSKIKKYSSGSGSSDGSAGSSGGKSFLGKIKKGFGYNSGDSSGSSSGGSLGKVKGSYGYKESGDDEGKIGSFLSKGKSIKYQ